MFECNKDHMKIIYGSQPCPLCASHRAVKILRYGIKDALKWGGSSWWEWGDKARTVAMILDAALQKEREE